MDHRDHVNLLRGGVQTPSGLWADFGSGAGAFTLALAELLRSGGRATADAPAQAALPGSRGVINPLHFAPKARRVIWLYMSGGPSHLETFDNKPQLAKLHGQPMPESFTKGQQVAQLQGQDLACFAPQFAFSRHGRSGQEISELFPHIGTVADDLCIIRSMYANTPNHEQSMRLMNCGDERLSRPSFGAWLLGEVPRKPSLLSPIACSSSPTTSSNAE